MTRTQRKLERCVIVAREASRDSWQLQLDPRTRNALRQVRREAIEDARYWSQQK